MDKKSVREAKVARKIEQRIKLKKRKLGNDVENLFQSPAHDQIRGSEDEPQAKFLKRDEPNKVEREMKMEKLRKKKRKKEKESKGDEPNNVERENKMDKLRKKKKKKTEKESKGDEPNNVERENKMDKLRKKKKRKTEKESKGDEPNKVEREKKTDKLRKKKRKKDKESKGIGEGVSSCATDSCQTDTQNGSNTTAPEEADIGINSKSPGRSKKAAKVKKKDRLSSKKSNKFKGKTDTVDPDEVYYISSEDEDSSKGMKKWVMEHHQSRPGLEILQQRIDEFITAHEEQEEQVRKERSAQAAEGGWTVVVHHKGRKKTTDSESGITVGSVAQAAVVDKMSKKKSKEVGIDFYRFQRREAQRNEIMMLQSKFEQDRKRIQQLRAARKFRPY